MSDSAPGPDHSPTGPEEQEEPGQTGGAKWERFLELANKDTRPRFWVRRKNSATS